MSAASAPGFWQTVRLLLRASRRRAKGRQGRQQELLNSRSDGKGTNWSSIGSFLSLLFGLFLNGLTAVAVLLAVSAGQRAEAELQGKFVVSDWFLEAVEEVEHTHYASPEVRNQALAESFADEAESTARNHKTRSAEVIEQKLRTTVAASGSRDLLTEDLAEPGMTPEGIASPLPAMLGSLLLLLWLAVLICQGEGLELDLQRRRHPMWEWLFSHPVRPGAVFFAEMLAPLASNPAYWSAPIFAGVIYGACYDPIFGLAAMVLIGIPLTVSAACLGKALEIGAMLRLAPRSRGAVIGLISWFGFVGSVLPLLAMASLDWLTETFAQQLAVLAQAPWPILALFVGLDGSGHFSFLQGLVFCLAVSTALTGIAVLFSARSLRHGLSGAFAAETGSVGPQQRLQFGRDPLTRKEFLWFTRDRSAIVQTILIPLTVAGFQLFNLRGVVQFAFSGWNFLCGAAILLGTYFLWVLGPKSLISEGSALWIALTWPRGLEAILKAKARLWAAIATGLVSLVLLFGCLFYPHESWKIAIVAVGWYFFARSMAEKSVTLVTVVSESGEPQPIPRGRQWAAQLGMLTFAIGVSTQQWHLAIVGIVYSWITAAAMWENLRARLPYLYDPWSEKLPPPPTLLHAMVAISALIECAAILITLLGFATGPEGQALALAIGYLVSAVIVSIITAYVLGKRGVTHDQVWLWQEQGQEQPAADPVPAGSLRRFVAQNRADLKWVAMALGAGLLLGALALLYLRVLGMCPPLAEILAENRSQMASHPDLRMAYALVAIAFAPFAEEYLFRGLLFRALDRQSGDWKAVIGAAAFFAIYHPLISWLPVGLLGAANCLLFKRSGRLAPAVLLHMTYNAVVTLGG